MLVLPLAMGLAVRYIVTGAYVGFATVGIFVQWYLNHGVTWDQLSHWGHCIEWTNFAPSLTVRPDWHVYKAGTVERRRIQGP